jgi:isopentenyldiphosphate isomerase
VGASAGDELVEVVDDRDEVIALVTRADMRARALRHRAVFVLVRDSAARVLIHQRSAAKDLWPSRWDLAAGGVLAVGESYEEGARREVAEELAITGVSLVFLGAGRFESSEVDLIGQVFTVVWDGPVEFPDGEVAAARWVSPAELTALLTTEEFVPDSVALVLPFVGSARLGLEPDPSNDQGLRAMGEVRVEFTVEPFVDGQPGRHVTAAWEAAESRGASVERGPFSSETLTALADAPDLIAAVVRAALAHGATHVSLLVDRLVPAGSGDGDGEGGEDGDGSGVVS